MCEPDLDDVQRELRLTSPPSVLAPAPDTRREPRRALWLWLSPPLGGLSRELAVTASSVCEKKDGGTRNSESGALKVGAGTEERPGGEETFLKQNLQNERE